MRGVLLRNVEVDGTVTDVSVRDGDIVAIGHRWRPVPHAEDIDGRGGALIPGLWDHHIHLMALAAARRSVVVGPPEVSTVEQLVAVLQRAAREAPNGWVRGIGHHESVGGSIDRDTLDAMVPGVPVRIQHRSGAMWVLSSAVIEQLGLEHEDLDGLERDGTGRTTGRLYGADRWLRDRLERHLPAEPPDLTATGRELAGYGIVGVTDCTPYEHVGDLQVLAAATRSGALPQHVIVTGGPGIIGDDIPAPLDAGPVKLLLADHSLPSFEDLVRWISVAHAADRPIAAHCVTRTSLALTLAALEATGSHRGDRIEHGAIVTPELRSTLHQRGLTVVTQPNFLAERGDDYLTDVEPEDRPHLYPCRSLADAGVRVAGSTDAPFGHPDPWRAIRAAMERRTRTGRPIGPAEAVDPATALGLFLGSPADPGGPRRRLHVGAPADLCLLHQPLDEALVAPTADAVRLTMVAGTIVHGT